MSYISATVPLRHEVECPKALSLPWSPGIGSSLGPGHPIACSSRMARTPDFQHLFNLVLVSPKWHPESPNPPKTTPR